nr:hypothetical protein [Dictyobacter kobayashii]
MIPLAGWIVTPTHTQNEPTIALQCSNGSLRAVRHYYRVTTIVAMSPQARQRLLCRGWGTTVFSRHICVLQAVGKFLSPPLNLIEECSTDTPNTQRRFSLHLIPSRRGRGQGTAPASPDRGTQEEKRDQRQGCYAIDTDPKGKKRG